MGSTLRSLLVKVGVDLSQYNTAIDQAKAKQQQIESSFRDAANAMKNWQSTSEGLSLRVSSLNQKIESQREVLSNLKQSYNAVVAAVGPNNEAAKKLDGQYIKASKTFDSMNKELGEFQNKLYSVATAEGKTAAEAQKMGGQIDKAKVKASGLGGQIKEFAQSSIGQFASFAAVIALVKRSLEQMWETIKGSAKAGDELETLAQQYGVTTETIQKMQYASAGLNVETNIQLSGLSKTVKAINAAQQAGKDYIEVADGATVSIKDSNGQLLDSEEIYYNVIDAIKKLNNETKRETAAQNIFGRSFQDIMPLINAGSKALKEYGKEAEKAGAVVDNVTIKALDKLSQKMAEHAEVAKATKEATTAAMAAEAEGIDSVLTWLKTQWEEKGIFAANPVAYANDIANAFLPEYAKKVKMIAYITEKSTDEVQRDFNKLIKFFRTQDMTEIEAYNKSFDVLADGLDLISYRAQLAADRMAELTAIAADTYDTWKKAAEKANDAVEKSTKKSLDAAGGMFDAFPKKAKASAKSLLKIEKDKAKNMAELNANLDKLAGKEGMTPEMIQQLREEGPAKAGEIAALASMNEAQFKKWLGYKTQEQTLAGVNAQKINAPLLIDAGKGQIEYNNALMAQALGAAKLAAGVDNFWGAINAISGKVADGLTGLKLKLPFTININSFLDGADIGTSTVKTTPTGTIQ